MAGFEKGTAVASASESEVRKERAKTLDKESVIVRMIGTIKDAAKLWEHVTAL
jgi:hypothetical protein